MAFGKARRQRLKELRSIGLRIEELAHDAQPLARIVDTEPRNSLVWQNAAVKLAQLSKESLELSRTLADPNILAIAENAAARVRTNCPVEAQAAGLTP